jgi:phenylpropionate dioxygenase-like ring-hydroxylating dioxygenase large terminal subunit
MNASQSTDPLRIPNGWFAVSWSRDLEEGEVKRIQCFGRELVLFRTRAGAPVLLDAYCPHLGAHLAVGGRVVGDTLRCPFHGWRFDSTGSCVEIPHCKSVPPAARVRSWDVVERNCMIFAWHHVEEKPPDWEVPLIDVLGHPDWTPPRLVTMEVAANVQELAENNNDPAHFEFVHGTPDMPQTETEYAEDGRFYRTASKGIRETPMGTFETSLVRETYGLGVGVVRSEGIPNAGTTLFVATTPIDESHSTMRWALTVTKNLVDLVGEDFMKGIVQGVQQDIPIWENKIHRKNPVLCETDGLIAEFRSWTRQFYSEGS